MTASIELALGDDCAIISTLGASLRSYSVAGRPVVVSMDAFDGAVLAPWPNRIADGRYEYAGRSLQLPITEPARSTALHGLVADVEWSLTERTDTSASLETTIAPTAGYPFSLTLSMDYDLGEEGLYVRARAGNSGDAAAPFGFGFHPWFDPGAQTVDDAQLVVPARAWLETDERLIPTATRPFDDGTVVPADHAADESACIVCKDFRALRTIDHTVLDDAYADPRRGEDGWSWARLKGADDREIRVGMGQGFRAWQVCTGDGLDAEAARRAIAIEPMTCPPNAFAAGADYDVIEPQEALTVEWCIRLAPIEPIAETITEAITDPDAETHPDDSGP